jgi:hypothetical protein
MSDDDAWFSLEADAILVSSLRRPFGESMEAINELERRSGAVLAPHHVLPARRSCADLRLDIAVNTKQSFDLCAGLYERLLELGVPPVLQLTKALIVAREWGNRENRAMDMLSAALVRGQNEGAPLTLIESARRFLSQEG